MKKTLKSGKVVKIQLDREVWIEVADLVDKAITRKQDQVEQLTHLRFPTNDQTDRLAVVKQEVEWLKEALTEFEDKLHES